MQVISQLTTNLVFVLLVLIVFELSLGLFVLVHHRGFPWILTRRDEHPSIAPEDIQKFVSQSHDPELGWVRRPNTTGRDRGRDQITEWSVDSRGARSGSADYSPTIAAFGDSYVFGRHVRNHETWPAQLSEMLGEGILNFGVGNYGADQALMRYERTPLPDSVEWVVLGFVPETISRIHSSWKHYLEFGNTLAFKPRFRLGTDGSLEKVDNIIQTAEDLSRLKIIIPKLRNSDYFYRRKFRSYQFRFPLVVSFLRHPVYNSKLIYLLTRRAIARRLGVASEKMEESPFGLVMRRNIREAHALYSRAECQDLLRAILRRFVAVAERRGQRPLVLVMPQMLDLELTDSNASYQLFFDNVRQEIPILDLTRFFPLEDETTFFLGDAYGGHLTQQGNKLVATALLQYISQEREAGQ
jgi:hypothetical protein